MAAYGIRVTSTSGALTVTVTGPNGGTPHVYSDEALTAAVSLPATVADATSSTFYVASPGTYTLSVKTASGTEIAAAGNTTRNVDLESAGTIAKYSYDTRLYSAVSGDSASSASTGGGGVTVHEGALSFLDSRVAGVLDGTTDNAAAFTAAWALLANGGELFIPPGVAGTLSMITQPGGVSIVGTGIDYGATSVAPARGSIIRALGAMASVIKMGSDQTSFLSGQTGPTLSDIVVDGAGLATNVVRTFSRRCYIRACQIYRGASVAAQLDGQNTYLVDSVIGQNSTGDAVVTNANDVKVQRNQIRGHGVNGAGVRVLATAAMIQDNHIFPESAGVSTAGPDIVVLGGDKHLITGNTLDQVNNRQILIRSSAGVDGDDITISGNLFYNLSGLSDNTYGAVQLDLATNNADLSGFTMVGNSVQGIDATHRYKSLIDILPGTGKLRGATVVGNHGSNVAALFTGFTPAIHDNNVVVTGTAVTTDQETQPEPSIRPTGAIAETLTRRIHVEEVAGPTSGTLRCMAIVLPANRLVTSITFVAGTTGAVTPTHQWFALLDSALNVLGKTSDDTTTAWSAGAAKTLNLAAAVTTTTAGLYYIGVVVVAGTTPKMLGLTDVSTAANGLTPVMSGNADAGLTDPTTLGATAAAITASTIKTYGYVS